MFRFRRPRYLLHTVRRVVAGLLAVAALALALRPSADPRPVAPATAPVVVAAGDLPAGVALSPADLRVARLPAELAPAGAASDPARLVGRVLAGPLRAREPVTDARLVGAGLTARLPPGQVAVPVRLADLAVTQLVSAGDRVNVLATAPDAGRAEVVAAGALVLAAPGRTGAPEEPTGLLLLAVDVDTAARLAAASTTSTVTVSLAPS